VAAPSAAATATPLPAAVSPLLTPIPEGPPSNPEAATLVEAARLLLRDRQFQKALEPLEKAAGLEPSHAGIRRLMAQARADARRAEIESLTTSALNNFVGNNYPKARKAVEKALALDPQNKKAKELLKILGSLG
jgi:tetratricopeptide (TPR) repeat protein